MKSLSNSFKIGILLFVGMYSSIIAADVPSDVQRDRILMQPYQRVDAKLKKHHRTESSGSINVSAIQAGNNNLASAAMSYSKPINLPGTAENNKNLRNAMNGARSHLLAMKSATQESDYDDHQNLASAALDKAVDSYVISRGAAKIPISAADNNDAFLVHMASLKLDLMQKSMSDKELDGLLGRLAAGRAMLVSLTEDLQ